MVYGVEMGTKLVFLLDDIYIRMFSTVSIRKPDSNLLSNKKMYWLM